MSYDITLNDPVTGEPIELKEPHMIRGGTYAVGGTTELWLNITYNYAEYYYEATEGDGRFAHYDECGEPPSYGIRGIYGKTGVESIPMLEDMIGRIEAKYKLEGEWLVTERQEMVMYDLLGNKITDPIGAVLKEIPHTTKEITFKVSEGDTSDYWQPTAANAIRPLYQLIAFAKMRPDGVWDGD